MADTKIQWATKVWNPVTGCTRVSPGCDHCYAIRESNLHRKCEKFKGVTERIEWQDPETEKIRHTLYWAGVVKCHEDLLEMPLHWRKPQRVFVNSMADLFHDDVPVEFIARVWATMASRTLVCRHPLSHEDHKDPGCECWTGEPHTFLVLTKRAERMQEVLSSGEFQELLSQMIEWDPEWPLPNVQLIVSCENQEMLDLRVPYLLRTPAADRGVSLEPMLGRINFRGAMWHPTDIWHGLKKLDWVICGGESGPGARPMHPDWVREVRDQCVEAKVAFFFKQWGEWVPDCQITSYMNGGKGYSFPKTGKYGILDNDGNLARMDEFLNKGKHPSDLDGTNGKRIMYRTGKKPAGRLLDGREWNELPRK